MLDFINKQNVKDKCHRQNVKDKTKIAAPIWLSGMMLASIARRLGFKTWALLVVLSGIISFNLISVHW